MTLIRSTVKRGIISIFLGLALQVELLSPLALHAEPHFSPDYANGIQWVVLIRTEQSGQTAKTHQLVYSATPTALRIDQPDNKGVNEIVWRLDLGKVYAIDSAKKTYREQSIRKLLSYQGFSDLIGQHAGRNPGDSKKIRKTPVQIAGYSCTPEVMQHQFRGSVVGMINGDQETVICQTGDVKGLEALEAFKKNLLSMSGKDLKPGVLNGKTTPAFFLSLTRVTHYKAGFIIKILNSIGLYDLSKVPAFEKESSTVQKVSAESFSPSDFEVPADFQKRDNPADAGNAP
ncbi:MAG: hypothetical protein ACYC9S_12545 [Leptospirales bacterium]